MKANPVYKCTRCGKIIVKTDIELDPDELSCVEHISTHVCDAKILVNDPYDPYSKYDLSDQIGIIKLVGYDEVLS